MPHYDINGRWRKSERKQPFWHYKVKFIDFVPLTQTDLLTQPSSQNYSALSGVSIFPLRSWVYSSKRYHAKAGKDNKLSRRTKKQPYKSTNFNFNGTLSHYIVIRCVKCMPGFQPMYAELKAVNTALTNNFSQATCHFKSNLFHSFKQKRELVTFQNYKCGFREIMKLMNNFPWEMFNASWLKKP